MIVTHRAGALLRTGFAACLLLAAASFAWTTTQEAAWAQEEDLVEETLEEPATPAPAPPAAAESEGAETQSILDTIMNGGAVGLFIILLSMVSLGFIIEHSLTIRKTALLPDYVFEDLEQMIQQGQLDAALQYCDDPENHSLATTVIRAGVERYRGSEFGFAEYKAAVEEAGEDQTGRLYRKTEVLGLIGSISPMLGLTGTVLGMIKTFNTIAATGGRPQPEELAGGIGQALVTTLMGLVVAIPTMVAFSFFRNKIDSLIAEAGKRIEQILMPLGRRKS